MCKAASQLKQEPADLNKTPMHFGDIELLLASFERITGESFGEIPMNPVLSSDINAGSNASKQYQKLLRDWEQWCGQAKRAGSIAG
jgi:hypothetical protein